MNSPEQIRPGPVYRPEKPVRDPLYKRFVKSFPCIACRRTWSVDPCHTGPHGTGQKSCDRSCIPLCRQCHRKFDSNPYRFGAEFNLDIPAHIARLNALYRVRKAA